jgi:hypothetical protein
MSLLISVIPVYTSLQLRRQPSSLHLYVRIFIISFRKTEHSTTSHRTYLRKKSFCYDSNWAFDLFYGVMYANIAFGIVYPMDGDHKQRLSSFGCSVVLPFLRTSPDSRIVRNLLASGVFVSVPVSFIHHHTYAKDK